MPLTYSIAYGIIGGLFTYLVINASVYFIDLATGEVSLSVTDHQ
jgi:xanthine/uracil/vitamin C permease (AzgA family)